MQQTPELSWEERYQAHNTGWDRGEVSLNLIQWLESGVLKPCRIMIPGCGNGYEVLTLAKQGFEVVAIDIAPTPVKNLRKALADAGLTAEVIESDFFDLDFRDKPFDAIYEQTCLCALSPELWQKFETWLYDSLKINGELFSQFMQTYREGGPPFHCDMEDMRQLFDKQHWKWVNCNESQIMTVLNNKMEIPCLLRKRA